MSIELPVAMEREERGAAVKMLASLDAITALLEKIFGKATFDEERIRVWSHNGQLCKTLWS